MEGNLGIRRSEPAPFRREGRLREAPLKVIAAGAGAIAAAFCPAIFSQGFPLPVEKVSQPEAVLHQLGHPPAAAGSWPLRRLSQPISQL
jgi:hypothetical protein